MRRITLGGPELKAHTAANGYPVDEIHCDGFDDHCKVVLRHADLPADAPTPAPTQNAGVLDWPTDELAVNRSYTIRKWRPEAGEHGEMDVDFVKHGVGPATRWAYAVTPGEDIQIAGPKACATQPEGADWLLIAGDETALPAIGRWLEEMPADTRGQVFIQVDQDDHVQTIDHPEGVEITWLPRNGAEAGTTTALDDEHTIEELTLTGVIARREAGLLSLLPAVRTGTGDYARWFGADFEDLVQTTPELITGRTAVQSETSSFMIAPLIEEKLFNELRTLRITLEPGSPLNPPAGQMGPVDATLFTDGLHHFPGADAAHAISQAASTSGSVLVFGKILNEELAHDHDYEADLLAFTLYGGGSRTDAEHRELFARAGVSDVEQSTVGWGVTLYRLG